MRHLFFNCHYVHWWLQVIIIQQQPVSGKLDLAWLPNCLWCHKLCWAQIWKCDYQWVERTCRSSLPVSNFAHTSVCTVKLQHPTRNQKKWQMSYQTFLYISLLHTITPQQLQTTWDMWLCILNAGFKMYIFQLLLSSWQLLPMTRKQRLSTNTDLTLREGRGVGKGAGTGNGVSQWQLDV